MKTALKITFSVGIVLALYLTLSYALRISILSFLSENIFLLFFNFLTWLVFFILLSKNIKASEIRGIRLKTLLLVPILLSIISLLFSSFGIFLFWGQERQEFISDDKETTVVVEQEMIAGGVDVLIYKNMLGIVKKGLGYEYIQSLDFARDVNIEWSEDGFILSFYSSEDGNHVVTEHYSYASDSFVKK